MRRVSHREYLAWQMWFEDEWNRPDRSDHYMMSLTAEVARKFAKNPRKIKTEDFRLEFKSPTPSPKKRDAKTLKRIAEKAKASWLSALSAVRKKPENPDG